MTPGARWLDTLWPLIRARLPAAPARVVEVGCGSLGGFVPMLRAEGYDAVGIDPQAPDDARYQRIEFERAELPIKSTPSSPPPHSITLPIQPRSSTASPARSQAVAHSSSWNGPGKGSTSKLRRGVSSASGPTTKQAGYIAAEMNGSPQATTGRATSAIGQNATGFIPGSCCSGSWTSGSSASFSRTGLTSFPISSTRLRPTSRPRSMLARSNRRASTT